MSIWADVRFDHEAASAAVAACRASAATCERAAEGAARAAAVAAVGWEGDARDGFDRVSDAHLADLEATARRCNALADRIERAAEDARHEQLRRMTARAAVPTGAVVVR